MPKRRKSNPCPPKQTDKHWWKAKFKVTLKNGKGAVSLPDLSSPRRGSPASNTIPGGVAAKRSVLDATLPGRAQNEKPEALAATEALKGRISVAYNKGPLMLLSEEELRTVRGKV